MAKNLYVGVGSKARKVKALYVGVGGKARKVKKVYVGVGGKTRLVYQSYVAVTGINVISVTNKGNPCRITISLSPSDATDKTVTWAWKSPVNKPANVHISDAGDTYCVLRGDEGFCNLSTYYLVCTSSNGVRKEFKISYPYYITVSY